MLNKSKMNVKWAYTKEWSVIHPYFEFLQSTVSSILDISKFSLSCFTMNPINLTSCKQIWLFLWLMCKPCPAMIMIVVSKCLRWSTMSLEKIMVWPYKLTQMVHRQIFSWSFMKKWKECLEVLVTYVSIFSCPGESLK